MEPDADNPPDRFLRWPDLVAVRPDLAASPALVPRPPAACYLATVSRVGRPRVTRLPLSFDGAGLHVTVDASAPAARDLRANPYFHLHATLEAGGGQLTVRGWARIVLDAKDVTFELLADAAEATSPHLQDRQEGPTPCPS